MTTRATLDVIRDDCFGEIECPRCCAILDVHQPDPDLSDRLLGTCAECKAWYLLDPRGAMVLLEVVEALARE
jgi:hypothetical protein